MNNSGFRWMRTKASQGAINGMRMVIYRDERYYQDEKIGFIVRKIIIGMRKMDS